MTNSAVVELVSLRFQPVTVYETYEVVQVPDLKVGSDQCQCLILTIRSKIQQVYVFTSRHASFSELLCLEILL